MIGHHSLFLGGRIQRVWQPRRESFDNVAVHGGVTVRDFIVIRWINNKFGFDSVPIHLLRWWIESMRIQFALLQNQIHSNQCERDKPNSMRIGCAFNLVLMSSVKGPFVQCTLLPLVHLFIFYPWAKSGTLSMILSNLDTSTVHVHHHTHKHC